MREITLRLTDEEFQLLDSFRKGRERGFGVYQGTEAGSDTGEHVLATDDGGGFIFAECPYSDSAPLIAAAMNGLFASGNTD